MAKLILPHVRESLDKKFDEGKDIILESGLHFVEFGIFGSYARDSFGPDSDVDFCIVFESEEDLPDRMDSARLRDKLDEVGCDCIGTTVKRLRTDDSKFYKNLRRDYRKVWSYERA